MKLEKLFRIKKTRFGIYLEPRYNLNDVDKIEKRLRKRKR